MIGRHDRAMTFSLRPRGRLIACIVGAGLLASSAPAWSRSPTTQPPAAAAQPPVPDASGPAQFYVLSFTDAPVTEVIEAVVGGSLGQAASVDAAIDGTMSFRAEGWYSPDALLAEFGAALLDQEVAMVRSAAGDLAVVPRADIAPELARGAALLTTGTSLVTGASAAAAVAATGPAAPIVYGDTRWQDGPAGALLIFLAGCAAGAGALAGGTLVRRRLAPRAPAASRLMIAYAPPPPASAPVEDPDLVIPRFDAPRPPLAR